MWDKKYICGTNFVLGSDFMLKHLPFIKKIVPEQLDIFLKRYQILKTIYLLQPTGRRSVSQYFQFSERAVRNEIEKLNEQKLIEITKIGMMITAEGIEVLGKLEDITKELLGISLLEQSIKEALSIKEVFIVQGNCDENNTIKKEIGCAASKLFVKNANETSIIAITGGSTMAKFVEEMPTFSCKKAKLIVPARGSIGRNLEYQSNTLAAGLAQKLKADYKLFNIADNVSEKVFQEIKNEPDIQEIFLRMQQADILIFGIGNALEMAKKRHVSESVYKLLLEKKAVAEAFGYYFDEQGKIVYISHSISIRLEDVNKISCLIAVAGGTQKAESILSISRNLKNCRIVMDEGAAHEILKILNK